MSDSEQQQPLLASAHHPVRYDERPQSADKANRDVDSNVLPETAIVGRRIGWTSAYILVISRVIGSGVFAMPGTVLQTAGSPALALILWIAGSLVAWAGLAIDLEYGCMLPRSGGVKVYLEYTYRWPKFFASTMVTVQAVLLGFTATNCIVFAKYTLYAFGLDPSDLAVKALAVGLLTAITIIHGCFYRTGIWIQNALGWLKIGLVVFMILTGLFVVTLRPSPKQPASEPSWLEDPWRDSNFAWNDLATSFFKIYYSYAGLDNINNVLNEVKNPVQTLRSVGPVALLTACLTYLLINIAYLQVVPVQEVKQSRELMAALFFHRTFGASVGGVVLPLAIAVSAIGNIMVVTFSLVGYLSPVLRELADYVAGSTQPRSCEARVSTVRRSTGVLEAFWSAPRWASRALCALTSGDSWPPIVNGLCLHNRR